MERVTHDGRETAYRLVGGEDERKSDSSRSDERRSGSGGRDERESGGVLYVHGSGATHRVWGYQYAPSGPAHPAAAVDLSGHGASEDVATEPGRATLDTYARDVVAVARETNAAVLVGHSLGGAVVCWVALETGFDPAALVLAGTGAKLGVRPDLRESLATDFDAAVDALHDENRFFHAPTDREAERSKAQLRSTGRSVTERDFLTCHRYDVRDRLGDVDAPALAVVGEYDELTPPASHEYLAEHLPDCEYAEIGDAAHLAMVERPAAFNGTVAAFLDRVGIETDSG